MRASQRRTGLPTLLARLPRYVIVRCTAVPSLSDVRNIGDTRFRNITSNEPRISRGPLCHENRRNDIPVLVAARDPSRVVARYRNRLPRLPARRLPATAARREQLIERDRNESTSEDHDASQGCAVTSHALTY